MKLRNLSDLLCCILLLIIPSSPAVCAKSKGSDIQRRGRSSCLTGRDLMRSKAVRAEQGLPKPLRTSSIFWQICPVLPNHSSGRYNLSIYSLLLQYVHRWHVGEDDRYSIFTVAYSKSGLTTNNQSRLQAFPALHGRLLGLVFFGGMSKNRIKCSPHQGFNLL